MPHDHDLLQAWAGLRHASYALWRTLETRLEREAGADLPEHELLSQLAAAPAGRLRMVDLAELLTISRSGVTRLMDRLVGRGWVAREQPADNRREVYATLTPAGRAVLERTRAAFASGLQDTLGHHLDAQEITGLQHATRKLLEGLGSWDPRRCEPQAADRQDR
jgi:DNA-binding MarR family transcriptional regulator